ncbi:MAG TPA: DNA methyltransferase, partial [Candidatus Dormibacteraeota bacterium]|nr:DNA methyltransferase [Candidatus Dormibacteraeota bacterium]
MVEPPKRDERLHMPLSNLNTVCPYFTMFPLEFPMRVLSKHHHERGWVFDPFCGRGTTNFAARLLGLPTVGIDSSPVASAIAEAKLLTASPRAVVKVAKQILNDA